LRSGTGGLGSYIRSAFWSRAASFILGSIHSLAAKPTYTRIEQGHLVEKRAILRSGTGGLGSYIRYAFWSRAASFI
jgi:hypothetical protein